MHARFTARRAWLVRTLACGAVTGVAHRAASAVGAAPEPSRESQSPPSSDASRAPVPDADATHRLSFVHTHTGERLTVPLDDEGVPVPPARALVDRFLRDHYSGLVAPIDPALLAMLARVLRELERDGTAVFHVISGYRAPVTNERLRARSHGVARDSMHVHGRAIDVRVPGVQLADLRDAALDLRAGGVGFYPGSDFVHLDTGRVRRW